MKKIVIVSLLLACLPFALWAQSANDDLYFIPKKKTEKKAAINQTVNDVIPTRKSTTNVYASPGSTVVVRDASGKVRDVDEYNRQYTARDNKFTMDNDTLYIDQKPLDERGEWVNGFDGSQDDYEYAMRIVRFRNPRFAIPVSSPFYWDVMYSLPSWEWNVYDDGFYAYAFPTFSNRLWWDWRWDYPFGGYGWGYSWYNNWYGPGYYGHYAWGYPYGCHRPYWGCGGWYGGSYHRSEVRRANNRREMYGPSGSSNRYQGTSQRVGSSVRSGRGSSTVDGRNSRYEYINGGTRGSGRVVEGRNSDASVRSARTAIRTSDGGSSDRNSYSPRTSYTRPSSVRGVSSSYNRPSSTRSSVNSSYNPGAASRDSYRSSNSDRSSYRNESQGSSSRSSYSSGYSGSSRSSYSTGGSSSRSSSSTSGSSRGRVR